MSFVWLGQFSTLYTIAKLNLKEFINEFMDVNEHEL